MAHINFEILVDIVVHDETVRQADSVRFHGMASHVGIVANIRIIEVGDLLLGGVEPRVERAGAVDSGGIDVSRRRVHPAMERFRRSLIWWIRGAVAVGNADDQGARNEVRMSRLAGCRDNGDHRKKEATKEKS